MEDPRTDELETPVVFGGIYDPEATLLCRDKVGQELTLTFGAKFDRSSSVPITAKGTVLAYIKGWNKFHGVGDIALFRSCGVDIVLSENHIGYGLPAVFGDLGRNPADMQIVVCKLGYLTAQQAAYAKRSIMALSKGSTNEDLTSLDYRHIPRPILPAGYGFFVRARRKPYSQNKITCSGTREHSVYEHSVCEHSVCEAQCLRNRIF